METVRNIIFSGVYNLTRVWSLILFDMDGAHLPLSLPHIRLLTFIRPLTNKYDCRHEIRNNEDKLITLFTCQENLFWLISNSDVYEQPQLEKVHVFCPSNHDQQLFTDWAQRYRDKIEPPFLYEHLDFHLLIFGLEFIEKTLQHLPQDESTMRQQIQQDKNNILDALDFKFLERINYEDQQFQLGQQPHDN